MVSIQIDSRQLAKLERAVKHIRNGVPRALVPAVNRALAKGRTEVRREIRKVYVIKQKDIPITIRRATYNSIEGEVRLEQSMLTLDKFRHRGGTGRKQLWAQVKKGGGGFIPRGFIPFRFSGVPFRRTGDSRLPIKRILAIGAPIMASQPTVGPVVNKAMGDTLAVRIDHEMNRVMASAGGH
jgi:hypothetical protein